MIADLKNLEEYIYSELNVQQLTLSEDEGPYNVKVGQCNPCRLCLDFMNNAMQLKGHPDSSTLGSRLGVGCTHVLGPTPLLIGYARWTTATCTRQYWRSPTKSSSATRYAFTPSTAVSAPDPHGPG